MKPNKNIALLKALSSTPSNLENLQLFFQSILDDSEASHDVCTNARLAMGYIDSLLDSTLSIVSVASLKLAFNEDEDTCSSPDGPKSND